MAGLDRKDSCLYFLIELFLDQDSEKGKRISAILDFIFHGPLKRYDYCLHLKVVYYRPRQKVDCAVLVLRARDLMRYR